MDSPPSPPKLTSMTTKTYRFGDGSNRSKGLFSGARSSLSPLGIEAVVGIVVLLLFTFVGAASGIEDGPPPVIATTTSVSDAWAPFLGCQQLFDRIGQACLAGSVDCIAPPISSSSRESSSLPPPTTDDILYCDPVRLVCTPGNPTAYESALSHCLSDAMALVDPLASAFGPSAPFPKLPGTVISPNDNWSAAKFSKCTSESGTCDSPDCHQQEGDKTVCSCSGASCVTWNSGAGKGSDLSVGIRVRSATAPPEGSSSLCPSAPFGGPTNKGCPVPTTEAPGFCGWRRPVDAVCIPDERWKAGMCMSHIGDGGLCASLGGVHAATALPGEPDVLGWCYFPFLHSLEDCLRPICNGDHIRHTDGSTVMCNRYCRAAGIHTEGACLHGLNQAGAQWDPITKSCHVHEHHCSMETSKVNQENSAEVGGKGRPQTNNYVWKMGRKWVIGHMDSPETCAATGYPTESRPIAPPVINPAGEGTCSTLCATPEEESPRLCKGAEDCETNGGWCRHALGLPGTCIRYAPESWCSQLVPWAFPYRVGDASLCVVTPKMNVSDCSALNDVTWLRNDQVVGDGWTTYPALGPGAATEDLCRDSLQGVWNPGVWTPASEIEDTGDGPFARHRVPLEWCSRRALDLPVRSTQIGILQKPAWSQLQAATLPLDWLAMARTWQDMLTTIRSLQEGSRRHTERVIVWPADHTIVIRSEAYKVTQGLPTTAAGTVTYSSRHPAYEAAWIDLKGTRIDPAKSKEHIAVNVKAVILRTDLDLDLTLGTDGITMGSGMTEKQDTSIFITDNGSLLPISEEISIELDPLVRQQLPTDMRICIKITTPVLGTAGTGATSEIFWADPAQNYLLMPRGRGGVDKETYYNSIPGHVCRNMRAPPMASITPTLPLLRALLVVRNSGGGSSGQVAPDNSRIDQPGDQGGRIKDLEHELAIARVKLEQAMHTISHGNKGGESTSIDRVTDCNDAGTWSVERGACICNDPFTMANTDCAVTFCGLTTGAAKGWKMGRNPCMCVAGWTGPNCDECAPTATPDETIYLCVPASQGRFVRAPIHILDIDEWLAGVRRLNISLLERPRVPGSQGLDCACQGNPLYDGSPATVAARMIEFRGILSYANARVVRDLSRGIPPWHLLGGKSIDYRTPGIDEPILNASALNLTSAFLLSLGEAQLTVDFALQALGAERTATAHQYFMDRSQRTLILIVCFGALAVAFMYSVFKCATDARARVKANRLKPPGAKKKNAESERMEAGGDLPWDGRQVFSTQSLMHRTSRPPRYMGT